MTTETKLNHTARENLMDEFTKRMNATQHCIINRLKYALDKAEFGRNHSLDQPMEKVEAFAKDAAQLIRHGIVDLKLDAKGFDNLAKVAKQIKESEAE